MITASINNDFALWRSTARRLLRSEVPPEEIFWTSDQSPSLLAAEEPAPDLNAPPITVPQDFLGIARLVSCFRDDERWALLYRVLWRLTHGKPRLLEVIVDDDVYRLATMEKAVRRDAHKMKAFVRFRRTIDEAGEEHYIAWHRPDHLIVRLIAPFFRDRFGAMRWTILTPDESAMWDGPFDFAQDRPGGEPDEVRFGPGVPRTAAPQADELEAMWKTYYGSIFNPARIKLKAMRAEMPKKHWATMPETELIDDLVRDAPRRVEEMLAMAKSRIPASATNNANCPTAKSAAEFVPHTTSLKVLAEAAQGCRGCQIYCNATQAVFGEGPKDATIIFVGEQPGDAEDRAGKPFIGPAGQILDEALQEVGIDRSETYVTNAVKHFKWEPRGTRRLHSKPSAREVSACRPWLETEIKLIQPSMIVCLGATAAQSLLGPAFRITRSRGELIESEWAPWVMATYHPSAILRAPDEEMRRQMRADFTEDLRKAAKQLTAAANERPKASHRKNENGLFSS